MGHPLSILFYVFRKNFQIFNTQPFLLAFQTAPLYYCAVLLSSLTAQAAGNNSFCLFVPASISR